MKPRVVYFLLAVAGIILPYCQFLPFLREHGLDLRLFGAQLFSNRISTFFGLDVIISTFVLWAFVFFEGRGAGGRAGTPHLWAPIAASLTVGVSLGLPLFLFLREKTRGSAAER
jgi:hypothetical protein